jgi:hypothetical protein
MLPPLKNIILIVKKFNKKLCMYISTIFVRLYYFHKKMIFFVVNVKRQNMSQKTVLHSLKDKSIFHGRTLCQVACEDVHPNFLF